MKKEVKVECKCDRCEGEGVCKCYKCKLRGKCSIECPILIDIFTGREFDERRSENATG